ncbi:unnamed protein product, partial [marine sediment metagenome]
MDLVIWGSLLTKKHNARIIHVPVKIIGGELKNMTYPRASTAPGTIKGSETNISNALLITG